MEINDYKNTLNNKTVLITGAGGGIGFETAKCFAIMGAKVIILEIDKEKGESAEKIINSIYKDKANKTKPLLYHQITLKKNNQY